MHHNHHIDAEIGLESKGNTKNKPTCPCSNGTAEVAAPKPAIQPFVGSLGGQQGGLNRADPENADILKKVPDAAPLMTLQEGFDLRAFGNLQLWKFGLLEGAGKR